MSSFAGRKLQRALLALGICVSLATPSFAQIKITEVHPTGSGSSTYAADWFELTNFGGSAVNITGWKMDDNSVMAANAVALRLVTSIQPNQSVVFIEGAADGTGDAALITSFENAWFGSSVPAGFTIGTYGGSGVSLGSGGDNVVIYDATMPTPAIVTGVAFGSATTGKTFDNFGGLGSTSTPFPSISLVSAVGVNGAFNSTAGGEVGSPGTVPEPASLMLFAFGFIGCVAGARRRK